MICFSFDGQRGESRLDYGLGASIPRGGVQQDPSDGVGGVYSKSISTLWVTVPSLGVLELGMLSDVGDEGEGGGDETHSSIAAHQQLYSTDIL